MVISGIRGKIVFYLKIFERWLPEEFAIHPGVASLSYKCFMLIFFIEHFQIIGNNRVQKVFLPNTDPDISTADDT